MNKSEYSMQNLGLIYGVSIGALSGIAAIPALKEITTERSILIKATRIGTALVMLLYMTFAIFVIVASDKIAPDALHGLGDSWWITLLAIGGFISVLTSYLGVGYSLFKVYQHDFSLPKTPAWLLTLLPPLLLLSLGVDDFTRIAALIGGVIGGTEGLIILASYGKIQKDHGTLTLSKKIPLILTAFVLAIGLFLAL